jgi:hypothetical protein
MEGELVLLFAELNPEFKLNEEGKLSLRCQTAQHGHIEAARLLNECNF